MRRLLLVVALGVLWALPLPAHAVPGVWLDRADVEAELRAITRKASTTDAEARWLILEPALTALPPIEKARWSKRIARRAGRSGLGLRAALASREHGFDPEDRWLDEAGFLSQWLAFGPHPASDLEEAHRPLAALPEPGANEDPATDGRRMGWRAPAVSPVDGRLTLSVGGGAPVGAVHFATDIEVPRATVATLHLGASGGLAASLDGVRLGRVPALAFARPDQVKVSLRLAAGVHRLALRVMHRGGGPVRVYARLTARGGRALPGLLQRPPSPSAQTAPETMAEQGPAPLFSGSPVAAPRSGAFADRLQAKAARRALGLPEGTGREGAEGLEDLITGPEMATVPFWKARLAIALTHGIERRSGVLDALVRGAGGTPGPAIHLARELASRGQRTRARALVHSLSPRAGEPGLLAGALIALEDGLPAAALRMLESATEDDSTSERLLAMRARAARAAGRPDLAADVLGRLARDLPSHPGHGSAWADSLAASGRWRQAVDVLMGLDAMHPDHPAYALEAARLAQAGGDLPRARALVEGIRRRPGLRAQGLASTARLYEALGLRREAQAAWTAALHLEPGDPDLRAAWEALAGGTDEALPFEVPVDDALLGLPHRAGGAPFEVLHEEVHMVLQLDGGMVRFQRRVLRVHRVPDDRESRTSVFQFDPSREQVRVLEAAIHREGLVMNVLARESYEISEGQYGLYYEQQALAVPFDDLRPGDVVVVSHRLDTAPSKALRGTHGALEILQETLPKHRMLIRVTVPAGMDVHTGFSVPPSWGSTQGVVEESRSAQTGGGFIVRAEARNLPALPPDVSTPGSGELGVVWQMSTFPSWDALVRSYASLITPQKIVTPAMRRWLAERLVDLGTTARDQPTVVARDLAQRVARDIRYVGLEFGDHTVVPYGTDLVWARRFGDCKDQATLLVTLLELAGIEAHVALVRTRALGLLQDPLPSLALFDHAIVYLPGPDRYVDPTARFFGWGGLPPDDQGGQVLVVDPKTDSAQLHRLPIDLPAESGMDGTYTITLDRTGGAQVEGDVQMRGSLAAEYRRRLADEDARGERLEQLLNHRYPGLALLHHEVGGLDDLDAVLRLRFVGRVPRLAMPVGDTIQIRRPGGEPRLAHGLASAQSRAAPLRLPPPSRVATTYRYLIPSGLTLASLPRGGEASGPLGHYAVTFRLEAGAVWVKNLLTLEIDQVSVATYPELRAFLRAHEALLRPPLVLVPMGATQGEIPDGPAAPP